MIIFFVNNCSINSSDVWYHFQKLPNPGNNTYSISISLDESEFIHLVERALNKKISDGSFLTSVCETGDSNSFNIVKWVLDFLEKKDSIQSEESKVRWVFNNITKVSIVQNVLVIDGTASEAYP